MQSSSSAPKSIRSTRSREIEGLMVRRGEVEMRAAGEVEGSLDLFEAVFSSEEPYIRNLPVYDEEKKTYSIQPVEEVLSHAPGAVDLTRLQGPGGLNFLREHEDVVLGRVETAELVGDKMRGRIRVDVGTLQGSELRGQWTRGYNRMLSVGYVIRERVESINPQTKNLRITATLWEIVEVSVVSISADKNAAVGARSYKFGSKLVGQSQGETKMESNAQPAAAAATPPPPPPAPAVSVRSGEASTGAEARLATVLELNERRTRAEELMRAYDGDPRMSVKIGNEARSLFRNAVEANTSFHDVQDQVRRLLVGDGDKPTIIEDVNATQTRAQEAVDNRVSLGAAGMWLVANEDSSEGVDTQTRKQFGLVREFSEHLFNHSTFLQKKNGGVHPKNAIFVAQPTFRGFTQDMMREERRQQISTAYAMRIMRAQGRAFSAQDNPIQTGQTNADDTAQELAGNADTMAEQSVFRTDLFLPEARELLTLESLGISNLNVSSDIEIPLQNGTLEAGWNTETGRLRDDSFTTTRITTSPERYGLQTNMTTLRMIKDVIDIEGIMRREAVFAMEKLAEKGLINGTGTANQITGLLGWSGIPVYNEAGNANSWDLSINNLLLMQENFNVRNEYGPFSLLLTPRLQTIARTLAVGITNAPSDLRVLPIATSGTGILEHPYAVSSYMPTNGARGSHTATDLHSMIMGRFSELFRIDYGPIRIGTDPYTGIDRSLTKFVWEGFMASIVRNTDAFLVATALNNNL